MAINTGALHDNIPKLLYRLVEQIQQQNSLNRSNQTIDAEDLFCNILNTAFDWNLINANRSKPNQETFDLYSRDNKLCVQVTSNRKYKKKVTETLQGIGAGTDSFEDLMFIFITKSLPQKLTTTGRVGTTEYEVFDVNTLYNKIRFAGLPHPKLQYINDALEDFTKPILSYELQNGQASVPIGLPEMSIPQRNSRFFIERTELIAELYQYAQKDNGLIIGGPGTGKSFTIKEFQRFCEAKDVPCYVIAINELLGATDTEINQALSIPNGNWIEIFGSNWAANPDKGVLIFDGFDTAKDETVKKDVLIQIQRAIDRLSADWSILASVRTYDAAKSERLVQMFPYVTTNEPISCRKFTILELIVAELLAYLNTVPKLLNAYLKCTEVLQRLLLTPYFLGLFVDVVNDTESQLQTLVEVETEEQLLKIYWQRKVAVNTPADMLLLKMTNELVDTQKLSCKKINLLTDSTNITVLDSVISTGILSDVSESWQLVSFNHNILLEYAVSRYIIPDDVNELVAMLTASPRIFFSFRQSFVYFYSRLWAASNQLFWVHYNMMLFSKEHVLKLFHQSVLNYVLASLCHSYDQLKPILSQPDKYERGVTIKKFLEGINFLKKQNLTATEDELFYCFSQDLSTTYAGQLGFLIHYAIETLHPKQDNSRWEKLSQATHLYLKWLLAERKIGEQKRFIDLATGRWGIINVCRTFFINPDRAFEQIQQTLLIFQEPEFPHGFYHDLQDYVVSIFAHNRQMGASLFKSLYLVNETSHKETILGNSVMMPLKSNRGQDFKALHHRLEKKYDQLLAVDSEKAIVLGLDVINETLITHKPYGRTWEYSLLFAGQPVTLVSDSMFWDSVSDKEHGPLSLLYRILDRLRKILESNDIQQAEESVKLFVHAKAAEIWRGLLQLFSKYPEQTKPWAFQLICSDAMAICNATTQAAAALLKVLWPHLTADEKLTVEQHIVRLQDNTTYNDENEFFMGRIQRFVGVLPKEDLQLDDTKRFVAAHSTIENHPVIPYVGSYWHEETEEERLIEAGVNKANKKEFTTYKLIEKLTTHSREFINLHNKRPNPEQVKSFLRLTRKLFSLVQANVFNERLSYRCDSIISEVCELISRVAKQLIPEDLSFVQAVALSYINRSAYQADTYETGVDEEQGKVYSERPRTQSVSILNNLLGTSEPDIIVPVIEQLFSDNSKTVRLYAIASLNWFYHYYHSYWLQIIPERLAKEKYVVACCELIHRVNYLNVIKDNREFIEMLVTQVEQQLSADQEPFNHAIWQGYTSILFHLMAIHKSEIAQNVLFRNAGNASFVEDLGRFIINYIDPKSTNANNIEARKYLVEVFQELLAITFKVLQKGSPEDAATIPFYQMLDQLVFILWGVFESMQEAINGVTIEQRVKEDFYQLVKPLITLIVNESEQISSGFMMAHTAYFLVQLLHKMLYADAAEVFSLTTRIVNTTSESDFTYNEYPMKEIVRMVETILADHRQLLNDPVMLQNLIVLLNHFTDCGWEEPLELVWRIKDAL